MISTLFCFGSVPVLILGILHKRNPRLIATGIALVALIACLFYQFRNGTSGNYDLSIGLDPEKYPITEGWTAEMEDPENGTVTLTPGSGVLSPGFHVSIKDIHRPTGILLTDPEGKIYTVPLVVEETENGISISY